MSGYIYLYRSLLEKSEWLNEPFSRGQAWVDLLLLTNYKTGIIRVSGEKIEILRGQCGWSELKLAERWGWSRGKVKRYINELENERQVVSKTNNRTTILTICNYEKYQLPSFIDRTPDDTTDRTPDDTTDGHQTDTNKKELSKVSKVSKRKDPPISPVSDYNHQIPAFEAVWKNYPRKIDKSGALKAWKAAMNKTTPHTIAHALAVEIPRWQDEEERRPDNDKGRFIPYFSTWLNKERWNDFTETEEHVL